MADAVTAELRAAGIDVVEDGSAAGARSNSGNLIARIPGRTDSWVSLFSHLDTVPHDGPIEVELVDGVFRSAGDTILGADNKAAVAVLMELGLLAAERGTECGLELIFTVVEEDGLLGATELDVSELRAPFGYALDLATPIGEIVTAAPTYNRVIADFEGVEAHSGVRPEEGRSAIEAAASAIALMELGRIDEETTANVGTVEGGSASNVVAGNCRIVCEARSLDEAKVARATSSIVDACTRAATEAGVDVDVDVIEIFRSYKVASGSDPLRIARDALSSCGYEPREVATGGGSDANALILQGYDCVLLSNGTEANHTSREAVPAANLTGMLRVCQEIAAAMAREPAVIPPVG